MRTFIVGLCGALLAASIVPAQEGKVIVVNSESKDLKRTAYRMRIPVERLKNARQALQEATDMAKRLRPLQSSSFPQLGRWWVALHCTRAEASIKELVSTLRSAAQDAREAQEYTDATSAVVQLLAALAQLDPDEALQIARKWPEPSKSLGEVAEKSKSEIESQFRRAAARQIGYNNPEAALKLWPNADGTEEVDFSLRAQIADSMMGTGNKEEAVKIMEKTISDLSSAARGQIAPNDLMQLVRTLSRVTPDRFTEAFRLLVESSQAMPAGEAPSVRFGNQVIILDNSEAIALNLLKEIQQRPALVTRVLDTMPNLKSKLEPVGGIDSVLAEGPVEISYGNQGALETTTHYGPDAVYSDQLLYAQLRGKDGNVVREKLSGMSPSREQISDLLNLASSAAIENPDLSSMALEQARKLVARIEPVSARGPLFAQMLRISKRCDGEVDPELFKQGFALIAQIRDEEGSQVKQVGRTPGFGRSAGDMLERALISELAIDDFERAIRYVRAMPEERGRITGLVALVEACRRPF